MKRAIILCGGLGTRLRPYTLSIPKPLMPIGNTVILEILIRQLASQGFTHLTLAVNHQADLIKAFCQNGEKYGVFIDYSLEEMPLGTIAPLKLIKDLPHKFLVINGDILSDLNYGSFLEEYDPSQSLVKVAVINHSYKIDFGVLECNDEDLIVKFSEKPEKTFFVSMGAYCINYEILQIIPKDSAFGFDDLMHYLLENHKPIKVQRHAGFWLDIGRIEDYQIIQDNWENIKMKFGY